MLKKQNDTQTKHHNSTTTGLWFTVTSRFLLKNVLYAANHFLPALSVSGEAKRNNLPILQKRGPKTFQTRVTKKVIRLIYRAVYRPQKMPSFQFLRLFLGPLSKMSIVTSVPISFLLVGLQAIMDVQFSCPCKVWWNLVLSTLILLVPALVALVIMLLLLRPCQYKLNCSQGKNNRGTSQGQGNRGTSQGQDNRGTSQGQDSRGTSQGQDSRGTSQGPDSRGTSQGQDNRGTSQGQDSRGTSQGQDSRGTSQGQDNRGTSQGQDNSGTSQSEKKELVENLSCVKAFLICCIPCLVWLCIFFIDGDYLACLLTDWDGRYACDKELHPRCLNWCKPNKLTPGKNETECYDTTRKLINISKTTGYGLAIFFSILAIIFVSLDCCEYRKPACCRSTDPETQSHERQGIEGQLEQRPDNLQMSTIENANEDSSLLMTQATT